VGIIRRSASWNRTPEWAGGEGWFHLGSAIQFPVPQRVRLSVSGLRRDPFLLLCRTYIASWTTPVPNSSSSSTTNSMGSSGLTPLIQYLSPARPSPYPAGYFVLIVSSIQQVEEAHSLCFWVPRRLRAVAVLRLADGRQP
jgi:hypothetical protein